VAEAFPAGVLDFVALEHELARRIIDIEIGLARLVSLAAVVARPQPPLTIRTELIGQHLVRDGEAAFDRLRFGVTFWNSQSVAQEVYARAFWFDISDVFGRGQGPR
jgi:hypothetical protein